jgi:signal transduction histidine kinase
MNRAFISLYLIIVLSIVLLGLVLNKFWDEVNPPVDVDPAIIDLITLIENTLENIPNNEKLITLDKITSSLKYKVTLTSILNFSKTDIAEKIERGELVSVYDAPANYFYKRLANSNDVLMLSHSSESSANSLVYIGFILLFYIAIAGAVFLWVLPLTRDLARLVLHAQQLGKNDQQNPVVISTRSIVYPFANAFNAMSKRLNDIMRSQKEMTLAVSHELRTPLARMKFALAMTEDQQVSALLQRQLASINRDILDMESLINSLLSYASFDQQSQQLNQREGHIQDLIKEIIARLQNHNDRNIQIDINDETHGQVMLCEWSLMQTAIQNIILNALGYAKSSIKISIKLLPNNFSIEVDDDGPGVSLDQREHIFQSFVRLYCEPPNRSGFGLGLALVKRIMDWHSGSARCSDSPLGGARFSLTWPR